MYLSETARRIVTAQMQQIRIDRVMILRGFTGALDPDTGLVGGLSQTRLVYTGQARCHLSGASGTVAVGEGQLAQQQMVITIPPVTDLPRVDDQVTITFTADAKLLEGSTWRVLGIQGGGVWNVYRQLTCGAWVRSAYWNAGNTWNGVDE
jgi:hypothetical protein